MSALVRVASTGTVWAGIGVLWSVTFSAVGGAGSVVLRDGGASGTIILTVQAASGATASVKLCGVGISNLHATITNGEVSCEV